MVGASLGGLIAIELAEKHPNKIDGALPLCAASGGTRPQFDYLANVRALFDALYPNVLPGDAVHLPPGTNIATGIAGPALSAMTGNPLGAFTIAAIAQTPVPFAAGNVNELFESILTALSGNASTLPDVLARTHGHPFFENRRTIYSSGTVPAQVLFAINATIDRFRASPSALDYMKHNYEPSGDLRVPMLMLSNARDPVLPGFHRASYLNAVTDEGNQSLLVQRQVPAYGHCVFTPLELGKAFSDLAGWVQLGIKPAP